LRKLLVLTGIVFCLVYFVHRFPGTPDPNAYSRLYQIRAVVEQKTLVLDKMIDKYGFLMDRSVYKGKTYSDKSFGLSMLSIPLYSVYNLLAGECGDNEWLKYFLTLFCVTLPHIIFLMLVYRFCILRARNTSLQKLFFAGYVFGTITFTYSGLFFSHVAGASMLGIAWIIIDKMSDRLNCKLMMILGGLIGVAVVCEYPLLIISVWLLGYLFFKTKGSGLLKSPLVWISFFGVLLVPIVMQMLVNYLSFENPFMQGYAYKASADQVRYHSQGFFGVSVPSIGSMWGILFSSGKGMFYLSPFMLCVVPAMFMLVRDHKTRLQGIILCAIILSQTWFAASVVDWQAGWTVGPRYYLAVLPFMLITILRSPIVETKKYGFRVLVLVLILWSTIHCYFLSSAFPYIPEVFTVPLWDFAVPLLKKGLVSPNILSLLGAGSWVSLFFPFLIISVILFAAFGFSKRNVIVFGLSFAAALGLVIGSRQTADVDSLDKNIRFEYLYARWGRYSDQLEQLYIINKKQPFDMSYHYDLAQLLNKLGFSKLSEKHLHEILRKVPTHKEAQKELRSIQHLLAQVGDAKIVGGKNPNNLKGLVRNIKTCMRIEDYKTAKEYISYILKRRPSHRFVNMLLECIEHVEKYDRQVL